MHPESEELHVIEALNTLVEGLGDTFLHAERLQQNN